MKVVIMKHRSGKIRDPIDAGIIGEVDELAVEFSSQENEGTVAESAPNGDISPDDVDEIPLPPPDLE